MQTTPFRQTLDGCRSQTWICCHHGPRHKTNQLMNLNYLLKNRFGAQSLHKNWHKHESQPTTLNDIHPLHTKLGILYISVESYLRTLRRLFALLKNWACDVSDRLQCWKLLTKTQSAWICQITYLSTPWFMWNIQHVHLNNTSTSESLVHLARNHFWTIWGSQWSSLTRFLHTGAVAEVGHSSHITKTLLIRKQNRNHSVTLWMTTRPSQKHFMTISRNRAYYPICTNGLTYRVPGSFMFIKKAHSSLLLGFVPFFLLPPPSLLLFSTPFVGLLHRCF